MKMWSELGDARPRFGDFEDYMNRPMHCGPHGLLRFGDVYEYLTRGEYWWMYLRAFRRDCSRRVARLKAAERRPRYYEAENERRRALAAERRKIRARATTNACPTREAILEAWNRRKDSHEAAIRFGSMLEDLKKLKQVVELADPTPADVVLPHGAAERKDGSKRDYGADEVEGCRADGAGGAAEGRGEAEVPELAVVRARAIWGEIVEGIGQSATALMMRLDALTDPGRVEDANMLAAWREKYANEITERTKKRWWRRLVEKSRPGKARKRAA